MFYNKKYLLLSILALFCISMVSAQTIIDEWTFTSATPQTSDILSKTMGNWDPALAGTSVPSAGILRDATGGNSAGAFYGDNLGLTTMPDNVVLTVEIADINHTQRDYWFEFLGTVGGNTRLDINASNGGIVIDLWGAGTKHYDGPAKIFDTDDYTGAISLTVSAKWDFANNEISFTLSGDGVGYTGTGSSAFSDTQIVSADLSAITNIRSMRVRGGTVGAGEYIELDKVTITTIDNTPPEAPVISNATETTVTGTAEANSTITVYGEDGTTVLGTGTTDGSGNYTVNFTTAQLPCTTIKVSAKDASNNESQKTDGTISNTDSDTPILRTALLNSCFPARLQTYVDTNPDEAQKGIIDVTLPPYSAAGNGVADDTQAIQDAIDDAYLYNFAVHLPANKIFLVSQQLRLITTTESRRYGHQFIGDANGAKPIIRLLDGSGLGGNNNYDDALIRFQYNNGQGGTEESKHYTATFRNIDIDMGNNPAATALTMAGAQHCVIEDIKIYGEAFNVGIKDLPGSGGSTVNVHIIGGNIGIHQDQNRTVPTLIGLVLEEQIERGIKLTNTQGPLVIAGFKISSTQAPSTDYRAIFLNNQNQNEVLVGDVTVVDHANSNLSLTDGSIEVAGANGVAIRNGRQDLSLVNVYIKANTLIENGVFTAPTSYVQGDENQWKKISKHYYTSVLDKSSVVIDGQSLNDRTDSYEFTGTITDESPDASIYTKHSYGEVPDFNNPNIVDITTYGATTANENPDDDDGLAIQSAIDDVTNPTSANFGKTVLIPRGNFGIDTPIVVKKGTKLIGTAKNISTIYANNPWSNDNGAIITTEDDANGDVILSDFSIMGYPRTKMLDDYNEMRRSFGGKAINLDPTLPYGHLELYPGGGGAEKKTFGKKPAFFESEQLYDLVADPDENINLANDPEFAEKLSEMRNELKTYLDKLPGQFVKYQ
jgi:hypothetical protein